MVGGSMNEASKIRPSKSSTVTHAMQNAMHHPRWPLSKNGWPSNNMHHVHDMARISGLPCLIAVHDGHSGPKPNLATVSRHRDVLVFYYAQIRPKSFCQKKKKNFLFKLPSN